MGRDDNEVTWTKKMLPTNPNCTKSKSHSNICHKNYYNINDKVIIQELLLDNSKDFIDNCNVTRVDNEETWIEEISSTNLDCTEYKSHDDNCNSNYYNDRVGSKRRLFDDWEDLI